MVSITTTNTRSEIHYICVISIICTLHKCRFVTVFGWCRYYNDMMMGLSFLFTENVGQVGIRKISEVVFRTYAEPYSGSTSPGKQ